MLIKYKKQEAKEDLWTSSENTKLGYASIKSTEKNILPKQQKNKIENVNKHWHVQLNPLFACKRQDVRYDRDVSYYWFIWNDEQF